MSDEGFVDDPILVLVSVAPFDLYTNLFATGPSATWILDSTPNVIVGTWSGLPLSKFQRSVSDLREMLRFPLTTPEKVGTVDAASRVMMLYQRLVNYAIPIDDRLQPGAGKISRKLVSRSLTTLSRIVAFFERNVVSKWKNILASPAVVEKGQHLWVQSPATISNSVRIEQALLKYLSLGPKIAGVLIVSSSAYVEQARLREWVRNQAQGVVVVGGGMDGSVPGSPQFFSGFCQYFSWEAIKIVANARNLNHGATNDEALTAWLISQGINWIDPGIAWSPVGQIAEACPMCENIRISVVRCTSHGSRWREANYMKRLHHSHASN